uniref:WAP domain-containing protein n=1 Tax=Trichuris muris TaxID=70415 RepID=A0A5S6Q3M3_TRIMR
MGFAEKPGLCPPTPPGDISPNAKDECTKDEDCPGKEKCCQTLLGKLCLEPEPNNGTPNKELNVVCPDFSRPLKWCFVGACPNGYYCYERICCRHTKPGECPVSFRGLPAGPPCDCDKDCASNLKCCSFGGRQRCVFPKDFTAGTTLLSTAFGDEAPAFLPGNVAPIIGPPIDPGFYSMPPPGSPRRGPLGMYNMLQYDEGGNKMVGQNYQYRGGMEESYYLTPMQGLLGPLVGQNHGMGPMNYASEGQGHYDMYTAHENSYFEQFGYGGAYGQSDYNMHGANFGHAFPAAAMELG